MDNKNLPIVPHDFNLPGTIGLTKREYAAIQIMAGYSACSDQSLFPCEPTKRAQWAVAEADALFQELTK